MSEAVSALSPAAQLQIAKVELKVAQAGLAALQARAHGGELIERNTFDQRAFAFLRGLRDRLLGMSARHAAVLAARHGHDPATVAAWLDGAMLALVKDLAVVAGDDPVCVRALQPDPILAVSEWADRHRILSSRSAAEAGPYRTARTPYLREIMDGLSVNNTEVRRIAFMKAGQIGGTEAGNCWLGYIIDHAPGPAMVVQPTVELAKRFSKQRVDSLIADSPRLRERVAPSRTRDAGNTVLMKDFMGGVLIMTGANSAVGLRSMPVRFLFLDEVDAYPADVGDEGDPIALAEARTRTFGFRSKTFLVSTPRMKGTSAIASEYERSDQRRYFVPCPHCGGEQVLMFKQLRYESRAVRDEATGQEKVIIERARYECERCATLIEEHHKTDMLARGRWKPTAIPDDPHLRGYHLSALYSPVGWFSWAAIAHQWESGAKADPDKRKTFTNTVLGEVWEEEADAVPDWQRLYERREEWPHREAPEGVLFLTGGADIQADRIELDVWGWGRGLESWLVEHLVLFGDPARAAVWNELSGVLSRTWAHASGRRLALQRLAIDTGAFTQNVYAWVRRCDRHTVLAIKGVPQYERTVPVAGPKYIEVLENGVRYKRGVALWTVSGSFFKRELYKHLRFAKPTDEELADGARHPAGFIHLPRAVGDEWCKQLVAEQQVVVRARNRFAVRTEWRPLRARNEAMDCRVYARAAAWLVGADRWPDRAWRGLEEQLGIEAPPEPPAVAPAPAAAPAEAPPQVAGDIRIRRVISRRRVFNPGHR